MKEWAEHSNTRRPAALNDDVTLVIVTFESAHIIERALEVVPEGMPVILVDNASQDDTIARARTVRPDVTVLSNSTNLGYGSAANQGLRVAKTPFAFLINPDVLVSAEAIETLLDAARANPDAAILGPRALDVEGLENTAPRSPLFAPDHQPFPPIIRLAPRPKPKSYATDGIKRVGFISGCALLFRIDLIKQHDLFFDEAIFLYFEETDVCLRADAVGTHTLYVPAAIVRHDQGESSQLDPNTDLDGFFVWHFEWSRFYVLLKHKKGIFSRLRSAYYLGVYAYRRLRYILTGRFSKAGQMRARLSGGWAAFLGRPSALRVAR